MRITTSVLPLACAPVSSNLVRVQPLVPLRQALLDIMKAYEALPAQEQLHLLEMMHECSYTC